MSARTSELERAVLDACLALSKDAMTIFDAVEARDITLDAARAVVAMGQHANDIALGVKTLVFASMR